jgi:hypothetical protein
MRINYNNTALGLIDNPKKFHFGFPDEPAGGGMTPHRSKGELLTFAYTLRDLGSTHLKELCGNNIQLVSRSFWEAFANGRHKLATVFDKEDIEEGGVLILPGEGITHTYYYYVKTYNTEGGDWVYDCLFIDFTMRKEYGKEGPNLDVYTNTTLSEDGEHISRKSLVWNGYINLGRDAKWFEAMILTFVLFKKYCDIETKVVEPKRKAVNAGKKYLNETDKRITILDSTWFTNLVVSGAFNVSGHLRWQACGTGLKERKLIWVSEYEKEGYTRKAKAIQGNGSK